MTRRRMNFQGFSEDDLKQWIEDASGELEQAESVNAEFQNVIWEYYTSHGYDGGWGITPKDLKILLESLDAHLTKVCDESLAEENRLWAEGDRLRKLVAILIGDVPNA